MFLTDNIYLHVKPPTADFNVLLACFWGRDEPFDFRKKKTKAV